MPLNLDKIRNPEMKLWLETELNRSPSLVDFGTPVVADPDKIVTIVDMKNGTYTIAAQPDVPRNVTVTHAVVAVGADALGIITVTGTNINGQTITEVITPAEGDISAGRKCFKTVTSVVGSGWTIAGGNDTITVGVGSCLGLPFIITENTQVAYTIVGTSITAPTMDHDDADISECSVSTGTYDGSKRVFAMCLI